MKSSTSHRAGSSRTFLKTMYLTSGAYVMTRRLRACTSPVRLYSRHSASDSSDEMRLRFEVTDFMFRAGSLSGNSSGQWLYRVAAPIPGSPIRGNRPVIQAVGPRQHLRHSHP